MIRWETYIAAFTGTLTTLTTKSGRQLSVAEPFLHVVKGQRFVLEIDDTKNRVRMVPLIIPWYWEGLR